MKVALTLYDVLIDENDSTYNFIPPPDYQNIWYNNNQQDGSYYSSSDWRADAGNSTFPFTQSANAVSDPCWVGDITFKSENHTVRLNFQTTGRVDVYIDEQIPPAAYVLQKGANLEEGIISCWFVKNESGIIGLQSKYVGWFYSTYKIYAGHIFNQAQSAIIDEVLNASQPKTYQWQSVPSISGKNGILSLTELNQSTDGNPVSGVTSSSFYKFGKTVKELTPNRILNQEQIAAYSGENELRITWTGQNTFRASFWIYRDGLLYRTYNFGYDISGYDDSYVMLLRDVRTESEVYTYLMRPSFVYVNRTQGLYSYNNETVTDEEAIGLDEWFVINYDGASIFGPDNEPSGGSGSLPIEDEPVGQPTLNNNVTALVTNFTNMYFLPNATNLNSFANWMADSDRVWDKLWEADPLQGIIEIAIIPFELFSNDDLFNTTIKIYGQNTEVPAYRLSSQFFKLDCGEYTFDTQMGDTYLDFAPYTTIKVFLPYIGVIELNTNDVMKRTIKLTYTFDVLWGICLAHIYVKTDNGDWSLHYERHGQFLTNIPITKADRGEEAAAIKGAVSTLASIAGSAIGLGVGTQKSRPSGDPFMGAVGFGHMFFHAADSAMDVVTSHPQITYSDGSVGGLSGYLGPDEPYIMIETPILARPKDDELYIGMPSYITGEVGDFKNYNKFKDVHLEGLSCTGLEQEEIYSWLTNGVIIRTGSSTPSDEPVHEGNSLLIFLKMLSEKNVIGKTFGNKKVLEGKLIYDTSIENPKFLVDGDIRGYNYVYVPIFSRFYYIKDITIRREMLQEIQMEVDVLQSFKDEIKHCSGIPERSGDPDKINYYINDGAITAQQNTRVITQYFRKNESKFSFNKNGAGYLLTVANSNIDT